MVCDEMSAIPGVVIPPMEGTYLVCIDLSAVLPLEDIKEFMIDKCSIACDFGDWFGDAWGGFVRINLASHPDTIKQVVGNMKRVLQSIVK